MTTLEARIESLTQEIADEIRLMETQLAKSTAARSASATHVSSTAQAETAPQAAIPIALSSSAAASPPSPSLTRGATTATAGANGAASPSPQAAGAGTSSLVTVAPLAITHKEGSLLHLVHRGGLFGAGGSHTFVPHYFVVTGDSGIAWYTNQHEYLVNPKRPLGHAAFWVETYNSRGSRFKKAAVCWPLILEEDCPAATDPTKTYFAVDYYTKGGAREQLVLAADSAEERDAWVQLLTKYIDLYLAPRAESEELQSITRGAAVPLHRSGVIEGEAPGGNIL